MRLRNNEPRPITPTEKGKIGTRLLLRNQRETFQRSEKGRCEDRKGKKIYARCGAKQMQKGLLLFPGRRLACRRFATKKGEIPVVEKWRGGEEDRVFSPPGGEKKEDTALPALMGGGRGRKLLRAAKRNTVNVPRGRRGREKSGSVARCGRRAKNSRSGWFETRRPSEKKGDVARGLFVEERGGAQSIFALVGGGGGAGGGGGGGGGGGFGGARPILLYLPWGKSQLTYFFL